MGPFELSFIDPVPGDKGEYRSFSRQLAVELQDRLKENDPTYYHQVQRAAAAAYQERAEADPAGEAGARYLHHLFEAREWGSLTEWLGGHVVPHAQVRRIWQAAVAELTDPGELGRLALEVAAHYVKLGAYEHPDALRAFETLAASDDTRLRAWTYVKRAEGEILADRYERAQVLLDSSPEINDPLIRAEVALATASILRWRGELAAAAKLVAGEVRDQLERLSSHEEDPQVRLVIAKATVWEGLIAKDRGELEAALLAFEAATTEDDLVMARINFQRGDANIGLGRFDRAMTALSEAVELARRSEALPQEQARYLARRGTLQRLLGEVRASTADFAAARDLLESAELPAPETDFWRAKIDDESAYTALAAGDFEEATYLITHALATFRAYSAATGTSASFRILRGTLHLAVAYACRGLAQPFRLPFPVLRDNLSGPDIDHARERISEVIAVLSNGSRYRTDLRRLALLLGSYFAKSGEESYACAQEALTASGFAHQRAHAFAALAAAKLRLGDPAKALARLEEATEALREATAGLDDQGDTSLRAQLSALESAARLRQGDEQLAAEALADALTDPHLSLHHEGLLRAFGEAADESAVEGAWKSHRRLRLLLGVDGTGPSTPARLPDALVAAWRSRNQTAKAS